MNHKDTLSCPYDCARENGLVWEITKNNTVFTYRSSSFMENLSIDCVICIHNNLGRSMMMWLEGKDFKVK